MKQSLQKTGLDPSGLNGTSVSFLHSAHVTLCIVLSPKVFLNTIYSPLLKHTRISKSISYMLRNNSKIYNI